MKLLIVDDERRVREMIANHLSKLGIDTKQVGNGTEAIQVINEVMPDAILTDIEMPKMDGLEMLRQIREKGLEIPVIIMSGYNEFSYAQKALRYRAVDYLLKPIDPKELQTLVKDIEDRIDKNKAQNRDLFSAFISGIIDGRLSTSQEINRELQQLGITFPNASLYSIMIPSHRGNNNIEPLLIEEFISEHIKVYAFRRGRIQALLTFFINLSERGAEKEIEDIARKLHNKNIFLSSSSFIRSLLQIPRAYSEALSVYRSELSFSKLINFYNKSNEEENIKKIEDEIEILIRKIAQGNTVDPSELLLKISKAIQGRMEDWNYLLLRLINSLDSLLSALPDNTKLKTLINDARAADSISEASVIVKSIIQLMMNEFTNLKKPSSKILIEKIKDSIEKNISNKTFTVQDAIIGVSYSENYIRYIFQNSEGCSIKEYIIKRRMERAFKLLNDELSIKEIAELTGYDNQRYFSRAFKEYTGITPTEWKAKENI